MNIICHIIEDNRIVKDKKTFQIEKSSQYKIAILVYLYDATIIFLTPNIMLAEL